MTNQATNRFEQFHKSNRDIPNPVLRAYLDELIAAKRWRGGLYNRTVTVSTSANLDLLATSSITDSDLTIRIAGQKYDT